MHNELFHKYGSMSVPRYTSYPTAPLFHASINAKISKQWLQNIEQDEALSLYIHIPYCKSLCAYCGCHTLAIRKDEPLDAYTQYLLDEIILKSSLTGIKKIEHLHWGGGTPSILGAKRFAQIFQTLNTHFDLSHLKEHAIELDPRYIDDELLIELVHAGINRVSFGVQDLNEHVQQTIGRVQPFEVVANANEKIRNKGIKAINMDLIYGLPNQTIDNAIQTAQQVITLEPSRLAVFGYAHVPWFKARQKLIIEPELPSSLIRAQQEISVRNILLQNGYMGIGIDHFALPDDVMAQSTLNKTLRRNFQGYTTDQASTLIGLGVSSITQTKEGYAQNHADLGSWKRSLDEKKLPTARGYLWSQENKCRAKIIEQLMCYASCNFRAIEKDFNLQLNEKAIETKLYPFLEDGLCLFSGDELLITPIGQPFTRVIASAFDEYYENNALRHAKAI